MQTEPDPEVRVFRTGNRVPMSSWYRDQYGFVSYHEAHRTFPPCIDRKGECALRTLVEAQAA